MPQKQPKRARLWRAEGAGLSSSVKRDSQQDDKRIISSLYFATPTAASFAFIDLVRFYVGMGELSRGVLISVELKPHPATLED